MRALLLALVLGGCPTPTIGTIQLGLTAAPGSPLIDNITQLHVTITHPRQTVIADRGPGGFSLALDVEATGESGAIVVEGFDAAGDLVAAGQSPEFGIAAIDARIVVYMGVPNSIDRAPITLTPERRDVSTGALTYGAIFAGGRNLDTTPSDAIAVYNVFDHSLAGGRALLAARDGIVVAPASSGLVYLYGGLDANDIETSTLWLFDTRVSPSGAYLELGDFPGFTRCCTGSPILVGLDKFVIPGTPPLDLAGRAVMANTATPTITGGASIANTDGTRTALVFGENGALLLLTATGAAPIAATPRPGGAIGALTDGRFVVAGGGTIDEANDLLVVDKAGTVTAMPDVLASSDMAHGIAATPSYIVITSAAATAQILDATTLASLGTRDTLVGALANPIALPNGQVLLVGYDSKLSLFTPPPPAL